MLQLFLCLLAASLAVNAVTDEEYGLGKIAAAADYMSKDYDVVIFVNDDMYNLGPNFANIETALTRYNGVRPQLRNLAFALNNIHLTRSFYTLA